MELAAVGVSIAVFNQIAKIAVFPLVSITTSFVAEEDAVANSASEDDTQELQAIEAVVPNDDSEKSILIMPHLSMILYTILLLILSHVS